MNNKKSNIRTIKYFKKNKIKKNTSLNIPNDSYKKNSNNINPEDYEELTKPTTVAVDSFVSGDLEWTKKSSESDSQ